MKRRNFVKTLASLAVVGSLPGVAAAAGTGAAAGHEGPSGPAALNPRSYASNRYSLELDGVEVAFLESVEGGNAVAEVLTDANGKRLGKLSVEPLRVAINVPVHADVTKLLAELAQNGAGRRTVGIVGYDFNYKATSFREYLNAVPTEVAFSKTDAASKNPITVSITFQAEQVREGDKGGAATKIAATKAKTASQFRFSVSGIDSKMISSVELPVWKRDAIVRSGIDAKAGGTTLGKPDLSNLTVEISAANAQPWLDWFEQFAVLRKDGTERTATLELLSADAQTVLYTVSLAGVGIAALRSGKLESSKEALAKLHATLYAERITYGS